MSRTTHSKDKDAQLNYLREVIRVKGPNRFPTLEKWSAMIKILHTLGPERMPQQWQKVDIHFILCTIL